MARAKTTDDPDGRPEAWDYAHNLGLPFDAQRRDIQNFVDELKLSHFSHLLPSTGRVLEVGAGSGRLLTRIGRERPLQLFAVDYSSAALRLICESAAGGGVTIDARRADARELPFPDGYFAAVLSGGLLEHFRDPGEVVREQVRVLAPGGLFYADVVPRKFSLFRFHEVLRMTRAEHLHDGIFESDLDKKSWRGILQDAGLREVQVMGCGVFPPGAMPGCERLMWKIGNAIRRLDGTRAADLLGWYYLCLGTKARVGATP
jgi:SAM-dependent methyltransferase